MCILGPNVMERDWLITSLKVGRMIQTTWVTWVTLIGGSSGSRLQTKLSGCDPDITCSLEDSVGIW